MYIICCETTFCFKTNSKFTKSTNLIIKINVSYGRHFVHRPPPLPRLFSSDFYLWADVILEQSLKGSSKSVWTEKFKSIQFRPLWV